LFSKIDSIFLGIFLGELHRSHLHMSPYTQVYQLHIFFVNPLSILVLCS
jgi:hypothetical protein